LKSAGDLACSGLLRSVQEIGRREEGSEPRFPQLSRKIYSGLIFAWGREIEVFDF